MNRWSPRAGIVARAGALGLGLALLSPSAWAAGGAMPSLVHDIGIALLVAGALGVIFTRLKIPSIAAFLLAGILIGPIGMKQVTDPENIDTIAQLGFILLLFLIGLEVTLLGMNVHLISWFQDRRAVFTITYFSLVGIGVIFQLMTMRSSKKKKEVEGRNK